MSRPNGPTYPLSPNSIDSFAQRYGGLGTPTEPSYGANPYGAPRPTQTSPPSSQHPSGGSTDMSGRPSATSSIARPPSSSSSVGGSRDGRMGYGKALPNRDSTRSTGNLSGEDALQRHYGVLKVYLASSLRDEKGNIKPNRARDKLLRLSATQFMELSTDVYDELMRREDDRMQRVPNVPRFLLPRQNFHPKRNQARQKLSTLPTERFRQLATDVFYELERRIPRFAGSDVGRPPSTSSSASRGFRPPPRGASRPGTQGSIDGYGRPLPKTLQQNTIVPNKGTMVEDDDEEDDEDAFGLDQVASPMMSNPEDKERLEAQDAEILELKARLEALETKANESGRLREMVEDLESKLTGKEEVERQHSDLKLQNDSLQRELDEKVIHANRLHSDLQRELDDVKRGKLQHEDEIRQLRSQVDSHQSQLSNGEYEHQIHKLQQDLAKQERITNEVRDQAMSYLQDMRQLSKENDKATEQEEKLAAQVSKLEKENEQWRERYAKVKAQNKSLRASTIGLGVQAAFDTNKLLRQQGILSDNGLVKDVDVTHFQMAIDELLMSARQSSAEPMLDSVKNVVVCVQSITSSVGTDGYPTPTASPLSPNSTREPPASVGRLKAQVTGTANSLITAAKQHSAAGGLSPVVLLDAAASNLTAAVVGLLKAVGIRQTAESSMEQDHHDMGSYYDDQASETSEPREFSLAVPQTNGINTQEGDHGGSKKPNGAGWFGGWGGKKDSTDESPHAAYAAADYDPYR